MTIRRVLLVLAFLALLIVILAFDQPHPRPSDGKLPPVRTGEVVLRELPGAEYGDRGD